MDCIGSRSNSGAAANPAAVNLTPGLSGKRSTQPCETANVKPGGKSSALNPSLGNVAWKLPSGTTPFSPEPNLCTISHRMRLAACAAVGFVATMSSNFDMNDGDLCALLA